MHFHDTSTDALQMKKRMMFGAKWQ